MKKRLTKPILSFLITVLFGSGNLLYSQTTSLLLEEDFDYAPGTSMAGQNGWTAGKSETNRVVVTEPGLTYPGYPNSIGNAISLTPLTDRIQKSFTGSRAGDYYYSFLIHVEEAGSGEFFIGFFSSEAFRGRTYIKKEGDGFQFGLVKTTSGTVTYTSGTPYQYGQTYLVVVKYEFITGGDQVSLYVNPDLTAGTPGTPAIGPLQDSGNGVSANVMAIQGRNNSGKFVLDGVRVATSWAGIKGESAENHYIELPRCISSHMVVQRETPLKFWGWGMPEDVVEVEFSRAGEVFKGTTEIDVQGHWMIELPAQPVCMEPCRLTFMIKDHPETVQTLDDILIGDVWVAGGQSNMEKKVNHLPEAEQFVEESDNYPLIRSFRSSYNAMTEPSERVNDSSSPWFICNSSNVADNVSAVAYVFARELQENLQIPVGIIQSYRGGTEIETWISPWKLQEPGYCKISGRNNPQATLNANNTHSVNFNGQINPLINYPIKGFLFYQGESNTKRAPEYRFMMKTLIEDWRSLWGQGDLPFYYIQMFNVLAEKEYEEANWPDIREQQAFLLYDTTVSNVGMAVIIDTNEEALNSDDNIRMHPRNKKPVGERIAKIALRDTYGYDILAEGPVMNRYEISGDQVYVYFRDYGDGLKSAGGSTELKGFVLSGEDQKFVSATASIQNDSTVVVKSESVAAPVAIRYAWARNPICNLYNSEELPAMPFRSDRWKLFGYAETQTSCEEKDGDASLVAILVNGTPVSHFDPEQFIYSVEITHAEKYPGIIGITNTPFATLEVKENKGENKIHLEVTAENGTKKVYELHVKVISGVKESRETNVYIEQEGNAMVVRNDSDEVMDMQVFNQVGQCLTKDRILDRSRRVYEMSNGIYLVHLSSLSINKSVKLIF